MALGKKKLRFFSDHVLQFKINSSKTSLKIYRWVLSNLQKEKGFSKYKRN